MDKTNADYIIEKLKQINFPFPRKKMSSNQLKGIETQLDEIQESLDAYKEFLSKAKIC